MLGGPPVLLQRTPMLRGLLMLRGPPPMLLLLLRGPLLLPRTPPVLRGPLLLRRTPMLGGRRCCCKGRRC